MAGDAVIVQGVVRGYVAGPPAVVTVELSVGGQYADVAAVSHYKQWSAPYCGGETFDTAVSTALRATTENEMHHRCLPIQEAGYPSPR